MGGKLQVIELEVKLEKQKGKGPLNKTKRGHLETTLSLDKDKSILGKRPQNLDKSTALPTELTTKKGNQKKPPAKQGGFNNPQRLPERNRKRGNHSKKRDKSHERIHVNFFLAAERNSSN